AEQNVVYDVSEDGVVSALNASNGALRWCDLEGGEVISPTAQGAPLLAVDQEGVYIGGLNGTLLALQASDGQQQWQAQVASSILALAVADGQVYVSSEGATGDTLTAFNASTGKKVWDFQTGNGVFTQ